MEQTCYRHPDRETGVSCSNCGRPICVDCMTPTNVGMRCPECSRQKTKVVSGPAAYRGADPQATYAIIAVNIAVFLGQVMTGGGGFQARAGSIYEHGYLRGFEVNDGEYWRLLTGGFLHADPMHLIFNMLGVFFLGQLLEPRLGAVRFTALYLGSLFAGSLGAILLSPEAATVGASGAVFGLLGAALVLLRGSGLDPMRSFILPVLVINLLLTFARPGISIGGHLGGLAGGVLCALILQQTERGTLRGRQLGIAGCVLVAAVSIGIAIWASGEIRFYDLA
jgi:membrane associated rhomboid family serine protease